MKQFVAISGPIVPVVPIRGLNTQVVTAGQSVTVAGSDAIGGYIINPATVADQGNLSSLHILYVDPTGPAKTVNFGTTVAIQPGGYYSFPSNVTTGIWVNSKASGHKFTAVQIIPEGAVPPSQQNLLANYTIGNFPPTGPTGLLSPIPSYLYQEYSDDDDLQAFVAAQNSMMQDIIDTFNGLNLPIYTKNPVSDKLLDWVAQGVYGINRPILVSGQYKTLGPYNTGEYNTQEYNYWDLLYPNQLAVTNDDIFRRIITWHVSKREGKYFTIPWLKKRIMKFLIGTNGTQPNVDQHYQISITFGPNSEVTIRFVLGIRTITGGAIYNANNFKYNTMKYNELDSTYTPLPPLPNMVDFARAVSSGVLELPFQFTWNVEIG
jgi:hypothetical protein